MKMQQVSDICFAVLNEKNRVCDANSGLINRAGGVVIDTQSDLAHARQMIEMFSKVWPAMPKRVVNTHEDGDHVWGNQLFEGAEIIAHKSVPERMKLVAAPEETQQLMTVSNPPTRMFLEEHHPGVAAAGQQLAEDYDLDGVELVPRRPCLRNATNWTSMARRLTYLCRAVPSGRRHHHPCPEGACGVCRRRAFPAVYANGLDGIIPAVVPVPRPDRSTQPGGHRPRPRPNLRAEGVREMKAYLQYVLEESKGCFADGLTSLDAAKRMEFGPYGDWRTPARLYMNVERAYREFRNDPADAPWDKLATFDAIYTVAKAKGIEAEF